jgi:hypothetical protein
MFIVTEADASDPCRLDRGGEFAVVVELRRLFPGVTDNGRECIRNRRLEAAASAATAVDARRDPGRNRR